MLIAINLTDALRSVGVGLMRACRGVDLAFGSATVATQGGEVVLSLPPHESVAVRLMCP